MIHWGIVSSGRIAAQFCQDLAYVKGCIAYGVAARDINHARAFAAQHCIEHCYEGYQAMFADPNIDVVYIATPHNFHFQNVYDALMAGKHVLCEKPVTVSVDEWLALAKLAKQKQLLLMEAMWTYFLPAMIKAKQWLYEGRIGKLKHVKVDFGYPIAFEPSGREYNPDLAGGCLLDMGIYPLAIAHYFVQAPLTELKVIADVLPNGVEDDVMMMGRCGEVKINLATSFQCKLSNTAYIIGDKGIIEIPDAFRASECSLFELDLLVDHFADNRQSLGYHYEAQEMVNLINQGKIESHVVSHQHSLTFQQLLAQVKAMIKLQ
ncbi:Gfo/Idh/MocA family protein [Shewanella aestuarii]|uniref:Gfo/Idh/MocA family oxidoreductase n=1 Tax=Shewanella aestuarii TaxID=1028752 RepID=A0A6G9QM69_9GAMM|nr:Gfo/Idh/MocA family oxidoreductase [Shewanella aestuarii]QIR15488.1 Gfo/Idh/MocA family oxidoreductase [Shewanella aestuarii]